MSIARLRAAFKERVGLSSDTVEERFRCGKVGGWAIRCLPDALIVPGVTTLRARIFVEDRIERTSIKGVLGVAGVHTEEADDTEDADGGGSRRERYCTFGGLPCARRDDGLLALADPRRGVGRRQC